MKPMYWAFMALTLVGCLLYSRKNVIGSVLLSVVWPILITSGIYYTIKKLVFKKNGPSKDYMEFEFGLCLIATIPIILSFSKEPLDF